MAGFVKLDAIEAEPCAATHAEEQARRERLRRWLALTPRQRFEVLESRGRVLARLRAGNTPAR